jgi:4a-hydroxytetrahydrobiopterin dehydratase
MDLTKKHCVACEGGVVPFNAAYTRAYLKNVHGWKLTKNEKAIVKNIKFDNFKSVISFVNNIAQLVDAEGHQQAPNYFVHSCDSRVK